MSDLGWILLAFVFGGMIGSLLTFRYLMSLAEGWKKLYYDLKDLEQDDDAPAEKQESAD